MDYNFTKINERIKNSKKKTSALYLENEEYEGFFDLETFDVYYNPKLEELAIKFESIDKKEENIVQLNELYRKLAQPMIHEMYHLYQSSSLNTIYWHIKANRKVIAHKWYILNMVVDNKDFKFRSNEKILTDRVIQYAKINESTKYDINDSLMVAEEVENYINYESDNLFYINLIEGAAFSMQLVFSKDIKSEAIPSLLDDPLYNVAYERFLSQSKIEMLNLDDEYISRYIFILVSHFCSKCEDYKVSDALKMFDLISSLSLKYFNFVKKTIYTGGLKPNYKYSNDSDVFTLRKISSDFDKLDSDSKKLYYSLCEVLDLILYDINNNDPYHIEYFEITDKKLESINDYLVKKFKNFNSNYFLPFILSDFEAGLRYFSYDSSLHEKIEFESDYAGRKISALVDTAIISKLNDLENLLDEDEPVYCCKRHGETSLLNKVINCSDSKFVYEFGQHGQFHRSLAQLIEV